MHNLELKTKIPDRTKILTRINRMGATYQDKMNQLDYYLRIGENKEKIREINKKIVEYIIYRRPEKKGVKDSDYTIKRIFFKQKNDLLKQKHPLCIVNKIRQLWMYGNTRIHLDSVSGLGDYLELETVLKDISNNEGLKEFNKIVKLLGIKTREAEPSSYSDLILNHNKKQKNLCDIKQYKRRI